MARTNKVASALPVEGEVDVRPKRSTRKRKQVSYAEPQEDDFDWVEETRKKSKKVRADEVEYDEKGDEVRKKEYLEYPSEKHEAKKARAISQPICVLERERCDTDDYPREKFKMEGSVGKNYDVDFGLIPKCSCPNYIFTRKPCKHIIYVVHYALKISGPLAHQEAYLSSELKKIFNEAPPTPFVKVVDIPDDPNRKPIEGECPICYMEFEPGKENILYCKAACGNNVHANCMKSWLRSQQQTYHKSTCPYCRNDWVD